MHYKWILYMAAVIAAATVFAEARRVVLRQLTADQVYTVLKAAGREDAVPDGRSVTQGIAAVTGLSLGLAKGIGVSILYDVVTSDATLQWLNTLNLTSLLSGDTSGSGITLTTEEICFSTKGRSIESDVEAEGRQTSPTTPNPSTSQDFSPSPSPSPSPSTSLTPSPSPSPSPSSGANGQTCIVIQKPTARRRRSVRRKRLLDH